MAEQNRSDDFIAQTRFTFEEAWQLAEGLLTEASNNPEKRLKDIKHEV